MSKVTLHDISLRDYKMEDFKRLERLRQIHFQLIPEICVERAGYITKYLKDLSDLKDPPILRQAKALKYELDNKTPIIWHHRGIDAKLNELNFYEDNLLAGSTTSKAKGVQLYPEFLSMSIWPELLTIQKRKSNPFYITQKDIEALNFDIYPFWMDQTIMEYARKKFHYPHSMKVLEKLVFFICSKPNCITHTIPDYAKVVKRGLNDVIREAEEKKANGELEAADFYEAVKLVSQGVINYAKNLSKDAGKRAAIETNPDRKKELEIIAKICAKVPAEKPETFREALNAIWICKVCLHQENSNIALSLGRLDQILYDLYCADIEEGRLTVKEAIELISCFWLRCGDHVPMIPETGEELFGGSGSNQAITLGGITPEGEDGVNDLTYVMLRATELMRVRDPNVNTRIHVHKNSSEYIKRLCEVNIITGATPCLHNDIAAIETLLNQGISQEHANDYSSVGCVEPNSGGRTYGHTGSILLNLTSALELTLFNGRHRLTEDEIISPETGDPETFQDFKDFTKAFETQLRWLINESVELNNYFGRAHQELHPTPLLSTLFEGPMEKGKDVIDGGALYNSTGVAIIGLADVIDSISAIEDFVYDKKDVPMKDILEAIKSNFSHKHQALRMRLLNRAPKFGTENPIAEKNTKHLMEFLHKTYQAYKNYRGGKYTVGYWTMTNHAGFGMLTGATPNGREAGESFSSGITPVSGAAKNLTTSLNFISGLDFKNAANGIALNLKYTPDMDINQMIENFADTVETYFKKGGLQVQFNIINHDTLVDAWKHPEKYPELFVRVSGYSAYFKDLNEQMKREIINRSEYSLETMEAVSYSWVKRGDL